MIIRLKMPIDYQFLLLFIEQLPHIGHLCACSLPCMRLLIAIGISIPYQLPQVGQLCGSLVECLLGRWKWAGAYSV